MTSDFDFLNIDRDKWKEQFLLMGFWKEVWGKQTIFGPDPYSSGPAMRIFFNFTQWKVSVWLNGWVFIY